MIRVIITLISVALMPLSASEPATIPDGQSPNAVFGLRQAVQGSIDETTSLELFDVKSRHPITSFSFGGYASFAMAVDPTNIKCLWAPDSKEALRNNCRIYGQIE